MREGGRSELALVPMLRNDLKLPYQFIMAWHSLLLTLLAVPNFKAAMANTYCDTYESKFLFCLAFPRLSTSCSELPFLPLFSHSSHHCTESLLNKAVASASLNGVPTLCQCSS